MKILEKYTGTKTYMTPSGAMYTPEVMLDNFPAVAHFAHVIETDQAGEMVYAVMNLSALRSTHEIDPALSEDEAIAAIEAILNAPDPEPEPNPEERLAAAFEFFNLNNM